jgi:transposase
LDVSKHTTMVCVLDKDGVILKEGVVETGATAIVGFLRGERRRYARVGIEACAVTTALCSGLAKAGLPIVYIETWHASRVMQAARTNKTDKNDARGIAELMRAGIFKAVHVKTKESQQIRAVLTARKMAQSKAVDIELCIGALLVTFGLKVGTGRASTLDRRVRAAAAANEFLNGVLEPLLLARSQLREAAAGFERRLRLIAEQDPVCRRLMTAPGVGPLVALTYRTAIDEPARFQRSRDVAAHLGLTPVTKQTGRRDRHGRISCCGDGAARSALYIAACTQLRTSSKPSPLKSWGAAVRERRGSKKAFVAVARRLAVILHRMWVTDTDFRWSVEAG